MLSDEKARIKYEAQATSEQIFHRDFLGHCVEACSRWFTIGANTPFKVREWVENGIHHRFLKNKK